MFRVWFSLLCPSIFGIDDWIIGTVAGAVIGGLFNKKGQESANEANLASVREQMAFQDMQSSTSMQRRMADLRAAGLNPLLAGTIGGADSGSGAAAQFGNEAAAGMTGAQQSLQLLSGAQSVVESRARVEQTNAATEKLRSETFDRSINSAMRLAESEWWKEHAATAGIDFQRNRQQWLAELSGDSFSADVAKRKAESKIRQFEVPQAEAESKFWQTGVGEMNPFLRQLMMVMRGLSSARGMFK